MQADFQRQPLIHVGAAATTRLYELGLTPDILTESAKAGIGYSAQFTAHDPPSTKGIGVWGKVIRSHRDQLVPEGWELSRRDNYETTVSPSGVYALAASSGNHHTGNPDETPVTQSQKGPGTVDIIRRNQTSFSMIMSTFPRPDTGENPLLTWLQLYYYNEEEEEIQTELSIPAEISIDRYVTKFQERIILPNIPFGWQQTLPDDDESGDDGEMLVHVRR